MERCFVDGVLALRATWVIHLQFTHLMGERWRALGSHRKTWNLLSWFLLISAPSCYPPRVPIPTTLNTLNLFTSHLLSWPSFFASKFWSLYKSHPPFWGWFRDMGSFQSQGNFQSLRILHMFFHACLRWKIGNQRHRRERPPHGHLPAWEAVWYPQHALPQTFSKVEHTFQQTSILFITF